MNDEEPMAPILEQWLSGEFRHRVIYRNAVIEECARVADSYRPGNPEFHAIAAHIRGLKEGVPQALPDREVLPDRAPHHNRQLMGDDDGEAS